MPVLESIGLAALGWVASPLVKKLLDEGFASLGIDAEQKLEEMEQNVLPVLKSVIEKAEGSPHRSEVERWLQRLKDAYEGAEDELDLLNYNRLRRKVAAASSSKRQINRVRSSFRMPKPVKWVILVLKGGRDMPSRQNWKLKSRLNKLEKIAGEAEKLRDLLGIKTDQTVAPDSTATISLPPQKVFGRDKDRAEIIRLLKMKPAAIREPGSSGIPTIAIVGRPGVGKTTLAQYICEQLRSELGRNRHFHPVMWVHASCNFNASEIMKSIIEQASISSGCQDCGNLGTIDSPEALRLKMNKKLRAKKFLLVIDDVRCDIEEQKKNWDTLFRCLGKCSRGSKILVTSQTRDAPRRIGAATENIYCLEELEENGFSDLFIHHALRSVKIDSSIREELAEKCKTIAKKLNKDPTAAEVVGETIAMKMADLLHSRDNWRTYLRTIAEKDWSGDKTRALMWSYRHLPAHLQRCFSYCSLYPRGYKFKASELLQLWMAQGFIKPDDQNERLEDVGKDYLEMLVSRFYIQSHDSYYTLHELLYDLAEKVSSSDCLRVEGNHQSKIPSTIRHLCIPANKLNENKEEICKLKKLRTLIITKGESATPEENAATDIFNSFKSMRVLVLELNLKNLAEFIGEMRHLRVLRVSSASKFVLPEWVCTLYQLQVLEVENATSLPTCLKNLVGLRYLRPFGIADIGKLTSLQGLESFQVREEKRYESEQLQNWNEHQVRPRMSSEDCAVLVLGIAERLNVERKEEGEYELEQLQSLNELRGRLRIANLENVESKEQAIAANLKEKKYLDTLQLVWRELVRYDDENNVNSNLDTEILEGLQLPPNLTSLSIDGYRGRSWPSWPEYQTRNIQELALRRCGMLEELPLMDQIFPSCRSLELSHLSKLKALHALPQQLTTLTIKSTPSLIFVTKEDLHMSPAEKRSVIEVMRKRMPERFPRQYEESLVNDEEEMMNFIAATSDFSNKASSAKHKKSVPAADVDITADWGRRLEINERKMELIYNGRNEARLLLPSTLTDLQLEECNITDRALSACLQTLTSLTYLLLAKIRTVTCLPSDDVLCNLKALQYLSLADCWALTSLGGIGSLPYLNELYLSGCPCLDGETAFLPSSLEIITFESCADVDVILANADLPCLSDLTITRCHMRTASLQCGNLRSLHSLSILRCPGLSFLVDVQELRSLEFLILQNCSNLQPVMNLPSSLQSSEIHGCPNLEQQFANISPSSGVQMPGGILVEEYIVEHAL